MSARLSGGAVRLAEPAGDDLPALITPRRRRSGLVGVLLAHPALAVGLTILAVVIFVAVLAPILWTVDPNAISPMQRLRDPSVAAWLGTDMLGRDVYSRVVYGARVSLGVGFSVAAIATGLGMLIGLVSGFVRWADGIIMRVMDGVMSIPPILLAVSIVAMAGSGLGTVVAAIAIAEVPRVARLVRALSLSLRESLYIDAAVTSGTSSFFVVVRHIMPNTLAPIIVQATYICASAMLAEAILSFIGAGMPPTIPSWGNIIAEARSLWQLKPVMVAAPGIALSVTILAVNLLGDGLRDHLDPRFSKSGS